jgi:hypothetical protein
MWDHVVATLPPNIAVAMDKTPSIDFKRKKGQVSSSAKKKNHRASGSGSASEDGLEDDCDNDPRLNILLRLEMGFSRSEVSHKINELRHQIANNENQRVILQKEKRECRKELMEIECALRKEGCDNFNEDDHWKDANADLQTTIRTMLDVNDRLVSLHDELKNSEEELHNATVMSHYTPPNKATREAPASERQTEVDISEDNCNSLNSLNDLNPSYQCDELYTSSEE